MRARAAAFLVAGVVSSGLLASGFLAVSPASAEAPPASSARVAASPIAPLAPAPLPPTGGDSSRAVRCLPGPEGRCVPPRDRIVTPAELNTAMEQARPELERCLAPFGARAELQANVRLQPDAGVSVVVTSRPASGELETCAEAALRRRVQPLQASGRVYTVVRARMEVGASSRRPPRRPPVRPPVSPPVDSRGYDPAQVHRVLSAMRTSLLECVPNVPRGMGGNVTLRVSVDPRGALTLVGVELPRGSTGLEGLTCMQERVGLLRVEAPPSTRTVTHQLSLSR